MATYPSRGQKAPNYWDGQLKDYIDEVAGGGGGTVSASDFTADPLAFEVNTAHTMAFGSTSSSSWKRYVVTANSPGDLPIDFGKWTMTYQSSNTSIAPTAPMPANGWYTLRTITDGAQLDIYGHTNGSRYAWVWVDGQPITDAPVSAGAVGDVDLDITFASALPAGHLVEVHTDLDNIYNIAAYGISSSPQAARCWKPSAPQPVLAALGDSYFTTVIDSSGDAQSIGYGMWQNLWRFLGLTDVPYNGWSGSGFLADPAGDGSSKFSARLHYITDMNPDFVVIKDSDNDYEQTAVVQTHVDAITAVYSALRTALPDAVLIFAESFIQANLPNFTTLRQAAMDVFTACQTSLAPYDVVFAECQYPQQWIEGTGSSGGTDGSGNADIYIGGDWDHPNPAGHMYLSSRTAQKLRPILRKGSALAGTVV